MAYEIDSNIVKFLEVLGLSVQKDGPDWVAFPMPGGQLSKSVAANFKAQKQIADSGQSVVDLLDGRVIRRADPTECKLELVKVTLYKKGPTAPLAFELAIGLRNTYGFKTWEEANETERIGQLTSPELERTRASIRAQRLRRAGGQTGVGVVDADELINRLMPAAMAAGKAVGKAEAAAEAEDATEGQDARQRGPGRPKSQQQ